MGNCWGNFEALFNANPDSMGFGDLQPSFKMKKCLSKNYKRPALSFDFGSNNRFGKLRECIIKSSQCLVESKDISAVFLGWFSPGAAKT